MIKEYIVEIGIDVIKEKLIDEETTIALRKRLNDFIEKQSSIYFNCTVEEECDFEGLFDYIRNQLLNDVQQRLFGTKKERGIARTTILSKAVSYSQAQTSISRKQVIKVTENAIDILHYFYRSKINRELKFIAAQIEETIIDATTELINNQTQIITNTISTNSLMGIDTNMQHMRNGDVGQVEKNLLNWFDAVSCTHALFPSYGYDIRSGTHKFYSKPLTQEAEQKYPPKISCTGSIQINDRYISSIDHKTIDYANRHQLPIILNIETAKKYLGNEIDPIQHEAEELVGEKIIVQPEPFPPAFPCCIIMNDTILFDYILFRIEEILDDGIVIISNKEQEKCPFRIKISVNPQTYSTTYSLGINNASNEDMLKYIRFLKMASLGAEIVIKVLTLGEILARGKTGELAYNRGFSSIDDEIDLLEKVVLVEQYFGIPIDLPEEIYLEDFNTLTYLARLLKGEECTGEWNRFSVSFELTEEFKDKIDEMDDSEFNLSYNGTISVTLYGKIYEISAVKIFDCVKNENLSKLKEKVKILDIGDSIKLNFIPGEGQSGVWRDKLYKQNS